MKKDIVRELYLKRLEETKKDLDRHIEFQLRDMNISGNFEDAVYYRAVAATLTEIKDNVFKDFREVLEESVQVDDNGTSPLGIIEGILEGFLIAAESLSITFQEELGLELDRNFEEQETEEENGTDVN